MITKMNEQTFHAERVLGERSRDLRLSESEYAPGLRLDRHAHRRGCISVVLRGTFIEAYGARQVEWRPRSVGFIPAGEAHSNRFDNAGARVLNIELGGEMADKTRDH